MAVRLTVWVARATLEERFLDCARNDMLAVVACGCCVRPRARASFDRERRLLEKWCLTLRRAGLRPAPTGIKELLSCEGGFACAQEPVVEDDVAGEPFGG